MSTILITGAGGFVGRALVGQLRERGDTVIALHRMQGDITDPATLDAYRAIEIDRVFHLAARTFVPQSWIEPADFHRVNTGGTINVLEFCRDRRVALTYVSAYLYGQPREQPIKEDHPISPNNPYALSKALAEAACEFYVRAYGVSATVVRPFNVYGSGHNEHFLVPSVLRQTLSATEIEVRDLAPKRDYLYISDLVALLVATERAAPGYQVYNAGTGVSLSVDEVIATIQSEAGTSKPVRCSETPRSQEIEDTRASIEKARCELGWTPTRSFRDGIRAILKAIREAQ